MATYTEREIEQLRARECPDCAAELTFRLESDAFYCSHDCGFFISKPRYDDVIAGRAN